MLRFEDPQQGSLQYGGVDLRDVKLDDWRGKMAVVTQAPFLFSRSIADNIALGRPEASRDEIRKAAKLACIDEDIMQFREGYDTLVGRKALPFPAARSSALPSPGHCC